MQRILHTTGGGRATVSWLAVQHMCTVTCTIRMANPPSGRQRRKLSLRFGLKKLGQPGLVHAFEQELGMPLCSRAGRRTLAITLSSRA
eukprot:3136354-Pyramimonas_sp.AAC.1